MSAIGEQTAHLQHEWETDPRWAGITRDYRAQDVIRLRGRAAREHEVARRGASRLWDLLHGQDAVGALGADPGDEVQLLGAGFQAIYLPVGRAADGNPASPMIQTVHRVNHALCADRARRAGEPGDGIVPARRRLAPVVVGPEARADGAPDAFELMTAMIEAGAAGVCFEDQVPTDKEREHLGGKVLVPTGQHIETLAAARFAADMLDVPSLVIARTGARTATLLTSDIDERDHEFLTGERTADGLYRVDPGLYACGTRSLAFAPYADLLWLETPAPDLAAARAFACVIHSQYPGKLLAYSCSPSFNWRAHLDDASAAKLRKELAAMGYRFQVTRLAAQQPRTDGPACAQPHEQELAAISLEPVSAGPGGP